MEQLERETYRLLINAFSEGKKVARQEVVEWGNEECKNIEHISSAIHSNPKRKRKHRCPDCWQAKLKEWGM